MDELSLLKNPYSTGTVEWDLKELLWREGIKDGAIVDAVTDCVAANISILSKYDPGAVSKFQFDEEVKYMGREIDEYEEENRELKNDLDFERDENWTLRTQVKKLEKELSGIEDNAEALAEAESELKVLRKYINRETRSTAREMNVYD